MCSSDLFPSHDKQVGVQGMVEALKSKVSSNTVTAKKVASDFQADVAQLVEPVANKNDSKKTSRFFGSWRDAK